MRTVVCGFCALFGFAWAAASGAAFDAESRSFSAAPPAPLASESDGGIGDDDSPAVRPTVTTANPAAERRFARRFARKLADGGAIFGNQALAAFARGTANGGGNPDWNYGLAAYRDHLASSLRGAFFAAAVEDSLHAFAADSFVKNLEVSYNGGGDGARVSADFLLSLAEAENYLLFAQAGGALEDADLSANTGLGIRALVSESAIVGFGGFYDWLDDDRDAFNRFSVHGEIKTPHFDLSGNVYRRIGDAELTRTDDGDAIRRYTADGWDTEAAALWGRYEFAARHYRWDRETGADESGWRYRLGVELLANAQLNVDYDKNRENEAGFELRFNHVFGGGDFAGMFARRRQAQESGEVWHRRYEKTRREYRQKIFEDHFDAPPTGLPARTMAARENAPNFSYNLRRDFHDPDGDYLICKLAAGDALPTGIMFDGEDSCLLVAAGNGPQAGSYPPFTIIACDGYSAECPREDGHEFEADGAPFETIYTVDIVANTDPEPTLAAQAAAALRAIRGEPFSRDLADDFTDGNDDPLTCEVKSGALPAGLTLSGADNCLLSGEPTVDSSFTITVDDGFGGTAELAYSIALNSRPRFTAAAADLRIVRGDAFSYNFADDFIDDDGDALTCEVSGALPAGLTLGGADNCLLSGTPADAAADARLRITARDDGGAGISATYSLAFNSRPVSNLPPVPDPLYATRGAAFSYNIADDITDADGDSLTCQLEGAPPTWLTLNGCVMQGEATADALDYFLIFTVRDGAGGQIEAEYNIVINTIPAAPPDAADRTFQTRVDRVFNQALGWTDADTGDGDSFKCTAENANDLPPGLSLTDANFCTLDGTPKTVGNYTFTIVATDDRGGVARAEWTIEIAERNYAPTGPATRTVAASVNASLSLDLVGDDGFADDNGDNLTCTITSRPTWLSQSDSGGHSGCLLTGTPTATGSATFTATASDGGTEGDATTAYTIVISEMPTAVQPAKTITDTAGASFTYDFATDFTGGGLTCAVQAGSLPSGWTLADCGISGVTFPETRGAIGAWTIRASNTAGDAETVYTLNRHPHSRSGADEIAQTVEAGVDLDPIHDVSDDFDDLDGDDVTCAFAGTRPSPLALNGCVLSGRLAETRSPSLPGFAITGSDDDGGSFSITYHLNRAPAAAPATRALAATLNIAVSQALTGVGGFQDWDTDRAALTCDLTAGALPPGLQLSGCALSGTPTSAGDYAFTISAADSDALGAVGGTVSTEYTMSVNSPVIASEARRTLTGAAADASFSADLSGHFTDADGDALSCTITGDAHGLAVGANCDALSGTYPNAPGTLIVTVTATDGDAEATVRYTLNRLPSGTDRTFSATPEQLFQENLATGTGGFTDLDNDRLACSTAASFDLRITPTPDGSCLLAGTPPAGRAGQTATFTVTADDGNGGSIDAQIIVNVISRLLRGPATRLLTGSNPDGGDAFTQNLADADGFVASDAGGALSCALKAGSTLPSSFTLSGTGACTLSGTMPTIAGTIDSFTIEATEAGGGSVETVFTLNRPPSRTGAGFRMTVFTDTEGAAFSRNLAADGYADLDGDTLHCEGATPDSLGLKLSGTGNCTLSGNYPAYDPDDPESRGTVAFTLTVSDRASGVSGRGVVGSNSVYEFNRHPVVADENARSIQTTQLGGSAMVTRNFFSQGRAGLNAIHDPDGDQLSCEDRGTWPGWIRLQDNVDGNPACEIIVDRGTAQDAEVTLRFTDSKTGMLDVILTVSVGVNPPPTTPGGATKTLPGATKDVIYPAYDLAGDFADVGGDTFTCALSPGNDLPVGLALSAGDAGDNCALSGTPTVAEGDYTFAIVATDSGGGTAEITYTLPIVGQLANVRYHFTPPGAALLEGGSFAVTISVTDFAMASTAATEIKLRRSSEQLRFEAASCDESAPADECTVTVPAGQDADWDSVVMIGVVDDNEPECAVDTPDIALQTGALVGGLVYDATNSNPANGVATVQIAPSDLDVTDANGDTALMRELTVAYGTSIDTADDEAICFAAADADVNIIGERGYTALHLVAYAGARGDRPDPALSGVSLLDWILARTSSDIINRIAGPTPPGDGPNLYFTPLDLAAISADNGFGGESGIGIYQAGVDKIKLAGGVCHYQIACDNARIESTPLIRFSSPNASLTAGESNQLSLNRGASSGLVSVTLAIDADASSATNSGEWDVADPGDDWHFGAGQCADTSADGECIISIANGQNGQNFNFFTVADADAGPETVVIHIKDPNPAGHVLGFNNRLTVTINPTDAAVAAAERAMFAAAARGDADTVETFLMQGINPNTLRTPGNSRDTALIVATANNHLDVVRVLLAADGIDVNLRNHRDSNLWWFPPAPPIFYAAALSHIEILEALIAAPGIEINKPSSAGNVFTPAMQAARESDVEVLQILLADPRVHDINKRGADSQRRTLLYWAAIGPPRLPPIAETVDTINILLGVDGIDVNIQGHMGQTPLDRVNRRLDIVSHQIGNYLDDIKTALIDADARCNNTCRPGDTNLDGEVTPSP